MSAWRLILAELHARGGSELAQRLSLDESARRQLLRKGLAEVELDGRRARYRITRLGQDVATRKRRLWRVPGRRSSPWRWLPTWLAPLPAPESLIEDNR
jgi:DNA-binding PadR family transcriptional regulator